MVRKALLLLTLVASLASARTPVRQSSAPEGIKGLEFLLGSWESHETTKGADGKEIPFTLQGKNTWTLDGKYLQIDESFEVVGMGKFANHILLTYNEVIKKYGAWWFSSRSPQPLVFVGERTEKTFVLTNENGRMRISYDLLEDGHYKAKVEVKRGEEWVPQTTAEYKRK